MINLRNQIFIFLCCLASNVSAQHKSRLNFQKVSLYPLSDIKLLPGVFNDAMLRDKNWLIKLEPDRLLSGYRTEAGLNPKAKKYGGWESQGVSGSMLGHYLSACAQMYASIKDTILLSRLNYMIVELEICQKANKNGYVAAIPNGNKIFDEIAKGNIQSKGFDLNGLWVPWYNLHKLFAGLIDVYKYTGNEQAKRVLINLSDWAVNINQGLSSQQMQEVLKCEYGGMNEVFAEVYGLTGNIKYLKLSQRFNDHGLDKPLSKKQDQLAGLHANTQIPKIIGHAAQYEYTRLRSNYAIASYFWDEVVKNHTYANGGNSESEHFGMPGSISNRLTTKTTETCNSYNMLKLSGQLFEYHPLEKYASYYESTLYNHILGSQNPETGMVSYFTPLASGYTKSFSTPFDSFWCCVGTGIENHAKYGSFIYGKSADKGIYVNLFIPSVLTDKEQGLALEMHTGFPESNEVKILFKTTKSVNIPLYLRLPSWTTNATELFVNGKKYDFKEKPGSYIMIKRLWKNGDVIKYKLAMSLKLSPCPDDPTVNAIYYGPILLAQDLGKEFNRNHNEIPVLVTGDKHIVNFLKKVPGESPCFRTENTGIPGDFILKPFYLVYKNAYQVYFNIFEEKSWSNKKDYYFNLEKRKALEQLNIIDEIALGEMQPERDHNLQGNKTVSGQLRELKYRKAEDGGWFAIDLRIEPGVKQNLLISYPGGVSNESAFDILIDNQLLASESVHWFEGDVLEKSYPIRPELMNGKKEVTIKFQAKPGKIAGEVIRIKIVKSDK